MNIDTERYIQNRRFSEITSINPDASKYPNYYDAKRLKITLREGDYLYIPYGWFHHVFSEEVGKLNHLNISVNFWTPEYNFNEIHVSKLSFKNITDIVSINNYGNINTYYNNLQPFTFHKNLNLYSIDEISHILKNVPLTYLSNQDKVFFSNYNKEVNLYNCTIEEFIQSKNPNWYIHQTNITCLKNSDFINHICPDFLKNKTNINYNIWINNGNVSSVNHYDLYNNVFLQLSGTKSIYLFPPNERTNLYLINDDKLENILSLKHEYYSTNKNIVHKHLPFIQLYQNTIDIDLCKSIINYIIEPNIAYGFINNRNIDSILFETLNKYLNKYFDLLNNLNYKLPLQFDFSDTGFFIENKKLFHIKNIPKNAKYKYIWFLNTCLSPTMINDIEISTIEGSLLIYPIHFSYKEIEPELNQDKWICSGYIVF